MHNNDNIVTPVQSLIGSETVHVETGTDQSQTQETTEDEYVEMQINELEDKSKDSANALVTNGSAQTS